MNRPVNFNDPSGHRPCGDGEEWECDTGRRQDPNIDPYKPSKPEKDDPSNDPPVTPEKDLKVEEPTTFLSAADPSLYKGPNACCNGNLIQEPSASDVLQDARDICGKLDPLLLNPELGGTNLSYFQSLEQTTSYFMSLNPSNPVNRLVFAVVPFVPGGCTAYNCVYDIATNTGDYRNIRDITVTPQAVGYTSVAIPIAIPVLLLLFFP